MATTSWHLLDKENLSSADQEEADPLNRRLGSFGGERVYNRQLAMMREKRAESFDSSHVASMTGDSL